MRRHYTNYFRGFPGIKEFRGKLVTEETQSVLFEILDCMEEQYSAVEAIELV
jgi:hypothetical protein